MMNQRGSALVTVLVSVGVLSAVIATVFGYLANSSKRSASNSQRKEYELMVASLREKLEDPEICTSLFKGVPVPLIADQEADVTINTTYGEDKSSSTPKPIQSGWESMNKSIQLERVYLRNTSGWVETWTGENFKTVQPTGPNLPPDLVVAGKPVLLNTHMFRVYLQPKNFYINLSDYDPTSGVNPVEPERILPMLNPNLQILLYANVNTTTATPTIATCYGANTVAATCESYGGFYDVWETDPARKCKPDRLCFNDEQGMVKNSNLCKPPYNFVQQLGVFNGQNNYICSWCNPDRDLSSFKAGFDAYLVISESPLYDYGDVVLNNVAKHVFQVTNMSDDYDAEFIGGSGMDAPFDFTGGSPPGEKGNCDEILPRGESCKIEVQFIPTDRKKYESEIQLNYRMVGVDMAAYRKVKGIGVREGEQSEPPPIVISDAPEYNFETVQFLDSKTHYFEVSNVGSSTATIYESTEIDPPFSYELDGSAGQCNGPLPAGGKCVLPVKFEPDENMFFEATVTLRFEYKDNGIDYVQRKIVGQGDGVPEDLSDADAKTCVKIGKCDKKCLSNNSCPCMFDDPHTCTTK
ncbi:MAG: hypothetical protein KDD33_02805 [Bdellovibrionales bacterium]|nr:hypothetical protein [Bdellovibrionales bacterium]